MAEQTLLIKAASGQDVALLIYAATSTVQVYETFLTLDEELSYIWRSKWTPIKCVFLIVRYLPISIYLYEMVISKLLSDSICSVTKWVVALGGMGVTAAADVFLAYRVYAFYGKNKSITTLLVILFITWEIAIFSLGIIFLPFYKTILDPIPQLTSVLGNDCISTNYPHKIAFIWVGMLSYQSILFIWVFVKVIHDQYESWRLGLQSDIYMVCIRDGLWAYFLIVVVLVFCVIASIKAQGLGDSSIMLLITTISICCCRLILNLRSTGTGHSELVSEHMLPTRASLVKGRPAISISVSVDQICQCS